MRDEGTKFLRLDAVGACLGQLELHAIMAELVPVIHVLAVLPKT
jgi:hypothetical protein